MTTRQYKEEIYETSFNEDKLANLIYPQQALGPYVDEEMDESVFSLVTIIISCTVLVIMTTITYQGVSGSVTESDDDVPVTSGYVPDMAVTVMALSWVLFTSFIFLTFGATRLFHISILVALVVVAGYLYSEMKDDENIEDVYKNMTIAVLVFASFVLAILSYYLIVSRTVSDSKEYRERERLQRMNNKYNQKVERIRVKHDQKVEELLAQQKALEEDLKASEKEREKLERLIGK